MLQSSFPPTGVHQQAQQPHLNQSQQPTSLMTHQTATTAVAGQQQNSDLQHRGIENVKKTGLKRSDESSQDIEYDFDDEGDILPEPIGSSALMESKADTTASDAITSDQRDLAIVGMKRRAPAAESDGVMVDVTGQQHQQQHLHHLHHVHQNRTKCRRLDNGMDEEHDGHDENSGGEHRRETVSNEDAMRSSGFDPIGGSNVARLQGGSVEDDAEDERSRNGNDEVKNQRPRGLLAQHRLQTTPSAVRLSALDAATCQTPGTVDLSHGREKNSVHNDGDSGTDECLNLADKRGAAGSSTSATNRRQVTSADSETFDDEDAAMDFDDDDVNEEEESAGYRQYRSFLGDNSRLHQTPLMSSSALNFFAGLPGIGIGNNGNPSSMTSLPPTSTSASMLVGLDYSMHRHHLQQLQQQEQLRHQLQLHQSRFESLMDRRFMPSPPLPTSSFPLPHSPSSGGGSSIDRDDACSPASACGSSVGLNGSSSPGGHQRQWTFQEQFKQLYEMSEDQKRKEFLDELFTFMQKRGTPVNRIPIMAKQTLDLYELFRLVVSKGGLVEVINKKLWREITKGLNLPSSITSAAFTLRTQYMKYLYPFECEKLKLSTLSELQYAVDGNRREGRRPSYCGTGGGSTPSGQPGDYSPLSHHHHGASAMPPGALQSCTPPAGAVGTMPPHLGQGPLQSTMAAAAAAAMLQHQQQHPGLHVAGLPANSPQFSVDGFNVAAMAAAMAARVNCLGQLIQSSRGQVDQRQMAAVVAAAAAGNQLRTVQSQLKQPPPIVNNSSPADTQRTSMEALACSRAMHDVHRAMTSSSTPAATAVLTSSASSLAGVKVSTETANMKVEDMSSPTSKRSSASPTVERTGGNTAASDGNSFVPPSGPFPGHVVMGGRGGVGSAHIKLASRNDGRSEYDTSIMASMEINGIVYQGVLFAAQPAQQRVLGRT